MEWCCLEQVMKELGFPDMFTQWVMTGVKTVSDLVVVNGSITQAFATAKRRRQGNPMSLFLSVIAMEYLNRSLNGLTTNKAFRFHPKYSKFGITHLSYADDLLLFSRGDLESIKSIQNCFTQFFQASGLQANLQKSSIYFGGVNPMVRQQIIQ
ncbi:MAG: reverse transcriptase domain-containing protein [Candidatus Phytoplasma australasiaticum]|nr:reverse transcriptase domain-containing protein [Candidatus Phytoplasma australasiaticum]